MCFLLAIVLLFLTQFVVLIFFYIQLINNYCATGTCFFRWWLVHSSNRLPNGQVAKLNFFTPLTLTSPLIANLCTILQCCFLVCRPRQPIFVSMLGCCYYSSSPTRINEIRFCEYTYLLHCCLSSSEADGQNVLAI